MINSLKEVMLPPLAGLFRPPREAMFEEQAALLSLIKRLKWKHVVVVSDQNHLLNSFGETAAREDLCVVGNILINTNK